MDFERVYGLRFFLGKARAVGAAGRGEGARRFAREGFNEVHGFILILMSWLATAKRVMSAVFRRRKRSMAFCRCFSTVFMLIWSILAICLLRCPLAMSRITSASRLVSFFSTFGSSGVSAMA